MGHWTGTTYYFKLNTEDPSYESIVEGLEANVERNRKIDEENPGEQWSGSVTTNYRREIVVSMCTYKGGPTYLDSNILNKTKENIRSQPDTCYLYCEDNGEERGAITPVEGLAVTIFNKMQDANLIQYPYPKPDEFLHYLYYPQEVPKLDELGEQRRFLRHFYNKNYRCDTVFGYTLIDRDKNTVSEKWIAYFLAYGTEGLLVAQLSPVEKRAVTLKEILYNEDHIYMAKGWGSKLLSGLTQWGVIFPDGKNSGNLYKRYWMESSPEKVTDESIEAWFHLHQKEFVQYPKFSKETQEFLKQNFPATYRKLATILAEKRPCMSLHA